MNAAFQSVLDQFHARSDSEQELLTSLPWEELERRQDEFLLPVGPDVGQLMNMLVKTGGARAIVEVGTSYGYSALWLGEAARATGGKVFSFDVHQGKQDYARKALAQAGVADFVEFILGDAHQRIAEMSEPIEFALIDHWKYLYLGCFDVLLPKLAPGAIIVADNVTYPPDTEGHIQAYRDRVAATPGMTTLMLPIGNGIELSRYSP